MKLMFEKEKQQKLIKRELEKFDFSLQRLANKLGIEIGKLNAIYYDGVLMSEDVFEKFSSKEEFRKYILEKKKDNWGQSIGGIKSRGANIKSIKFPLESVELAELFGIMLGDGNLTKRKAYRIGTYQAKIVGDSRHDKKYLLEYVKPLINKLFGIDVTNYYSKYGNALYIVATGKKLVEFLETKGFKSGDKIINQLEIPPWIKKDKNFLKRCIRGLYDTDGSVYKLTNQNSYQICFTNYNKKLMRDVREGLLSLEINPSQITKGRDLLITKKSELRKFLNEIGFKNSRHLDKVERWNLNSPIV